MRRTRANAVNIRKFADGDQKWKVLLLLYIPFPFTTRGFEILLPGESPYHPKIAEELCIGFFSNCSQRFGVCG